MGNAALTQALAAAFELWAVEWPQSKFAKNPRAVLELWVEALNGIPLAAIPEAARRAVADGEFAPTAHRFRKLVYDVDRDHELAKQAAWRARGADMEDRHAGLKCRACAPDARCRARYYDVRDGVGRLLFECDARRRQLQLSASQAGLPDGW